MRDNFGRSGIQIIADTGCSQNCANGLFAKRNVRRLLHHPERYVTNKRRSIHQPAGVTGQKRSGSNQRRLLPASAASPETITTLLRDAFHTPRAVCAGALSVFWTAVLNKQYWDF